MKIEYIIGSLSLFFILSCINIISISYMATAKLFRQMVQIKNAIFLYSSNHGAKYNTVKNTNYSDIMITYIKLRPYESHKGSIKKLNMREVNVEIA